MLAFFLFILFASFDLRALETCFWMFLDVQEVSIFQMIGQVGYRRPDRSHFKLDLDRHWQDIAKRMDFSPRQRLG